MEVISSKYKFFFRLILVLKIILISIILILFLIKNSTIKTDIDKEKFNNNFDYSKYGRNLITKKMKNQAGWLLTPTQARFINGIISYHKPKRCLEVGVADGGSAVLILNSLRIINNDSILISLDLYENLYNNITKKTGYRVKKYFPELMKNWKLFTGDQPHKFLEKLNMKFDFVFLDTSHHSPGELINILEILPFLNEKAIVVLHDINIHLYKNIKSLNYRPTQIYLMSCLFGEKVYVKNKHHIIDNIGAVFLHENQQKHYLDYFLLLTTLWEYMLSDAQINDLRIFIKKYYKEKIYLDLFNRSVRRSKQFLNKYNKFLNKNNITTKFFLK